ncbi:purine-nucleoside phosphorylase [Pseudolysinimonas kribbensis]|uniref:Uridine phosphorylase n=1 Tax=Pseudolysinimonas kribbensis TaxID=433641 RepID=A0ABQ6K331_9MICO|nr:purine-nucleoside phosphorylase [Pseudolysinimonas kribbensis]GMA94141.1 purine nucleoside phosphorylase DeoD-type [Pseudolysinimonas kribbensis]
MATPHIAAEPGDIAPHVLMPGDPRRARRIAERFFDEPRLVTEVRGILGFTGGYRGEPVSVLASGMGMPSLAIYATELARFYGVRRIVRVGTMGSLQPETARLGDVVIASSAHTDSAMSGFRVPGVGLSHAPAYPLLRAAADAAAVSGARVHVGPVFSSDAFYHPRPELGQALAAIGTLGIEMEAAGLYDVAAAEGVEALAICTVSDYVIGPEESMTSDQRESTFDASVELALAAVRA